MFRSGMEVAALAVFLAAQGCVISATRVPKDWTPQTGRSLEAFDLQGLYNGCAQGPQGVNSQETMSNPPDWWEANWGRTGASWPRRGTQECWANRGDVCALPDRDHTVCLPGSKRGSTLNRGWALDPKSESCQPGVRCLYACEPGYYWTTFNQSETSNFDAVNGPQRGHCDGTWDYGTSTHGVYCREDGTLELPEDKPLCQMGEDYVFAENHLDTHVFLCQTVFPGHEIFLIPTLVKPGESVMITTQPADYWHGPTYQKPTHGDFYVSFSGADIMEACTWDEISPSGASMLPYEIGSGVEDNGFVYSTHYFYQQPNSEVPLNKVGYQLDLECESSEPGVCGPVFRNADVVKVDVLRKPSPGTTKVKFLFSPDASHVNFPDTYTDPNHNFLEPAKIPDPSSRPTPSVPSGSPVTPHGGVDGKGFFPDPDTFTALPPPAEATPAVPAPPRQPAPGQFPQGRPAPGGLPQGPPFPEPPPQVEAFPEASLDVRPFSGRATPEPSPEARPVPVSEPAFQAPHGHAVCIDGNCYNSMDEYLAKSSGSSPGGSDPFGSGRASTFGNLRTEDVKYVANSLEGSGALRMGRR